MKGVELLYEYNKLPHNEIFTEFCFYSLILYCVVCGKILEGEYFANDAQFVPLMLVNGKFTKDLSSYLPKFPCQLLHQY